MLLHYNLPCFLKNSFDTSIFVYLIYCESLWILLIYVYTFLLVPLIVVHRSLMLIFKAGSLYLEGWYNDFVSWEIWSHSFLAITPSSLQIWNCRPISIPSMCYIDLFEMFRMALNDMNTFDFKTLILYVCLIWLWIIGWLCFTVY